MCHRCPRSGRGGMLAVQHAISRWIEARHASKSSRQEAADLPQPLRLQTQLTRRPAPRWALAQPTGCRHDLPSCQEGRTALVVAAYAESRRIAPTPHSQRHDPTPVATARGAIRDQVEVLKPTSHHGRQRARSPSHPQSQEALKISHKHEAICADCCLPQQSTTTSHRSG